MWRSRKSNQHRSFFVFCHKPSLTPFRKNVFCGKSRFVFLPSLMEKLQNKMMRTISLSMLASSLEIMIDQELLSMEVESAKEG